MSNKFKQIGVKNCTYYFFDDRINIKNLDLNKTKIDKKPYKNILICYIGYVTVKNPSNIKISSVNPLYLIITKIKVYIEEKGENKYLTVVPIDKSKAH